MNPFSDQEISIGIDEDVLSIGRLLVAIDEQAIDELRHLVKMLREAKSAAEILGYTPINRGTRADAIERPISAAYYASLASYRRDEPPQDSFGGRIAEVTGLLDQARAEMQRLFPSFRTTLRRGRQTVGFARAWTTALLALDVVPPEDLPGILMFSPISPFSKDAQGDAMCAAEDHYDDPAIPIGDAGADLDFEGPIQSTLFDAAA